MGLPSLVKLNTSLTKSSWQKIIARCSWPCLRDIRVILVKLSDRLHNMRTLKHLRKDKQERISKETMEIYAPLAHRLGISSVKWELEDLSFRYLNPTEFYKITHMMKEKRREREALVDEVVTKLEDYTTDRHLKGRFTVVPSIFTRFSAKCRIRENGLRKSMT